jgi:hypothetical protein
MGGLTANMSDFTKGFWAGAGVLVAIWLAGKVFRVI